MFADFGATPFSKIAPIMNSGVEVLAACLLLLLAGCGDKAKDLYDTAQLEEKQFNKPHATKLYLQIVEKHPDSPYANQAKTRLAELEKAR